MIMGMGQQLLEIDFDNVSFSGRCLLFREILVLGFGVFLDVQMLRIFLFKVGVYSGLVNRIGQEVWCFY